MGQLVQQRGIPTFGRGAGHRAGSLVAGGAQQFDGRRLELAELTHRRLVGNEGTPALDDRVLGDGRVGGNV